MNDKVHRLEQASSELDVKVSQEATSLPLKTKPHNDSRRENTNVSNPSVIQSVSYETQRNKNTGSSTSKTTSLAAKGNKDKHSGMLQSTSPTTETIQDAETNQDSVQSTFPTTETSQDFVQSTFPTTTTNQDAGQSTSTTTRINGDAVTPTSNLCLPALEMNQDATQETASTMDGQLSAMDDSSLPLDPPSYHDIIPLIEDGSNVPAPPPSTFKSLCFCFFGAYRLYYASKIRNSRWILILLVALLPLPVSAVYMGLKYYNSCSVTPRTPLLLFLMGAVGIILNVLRILTVISRTFKDLGVCEPPRIVIESSVLFILSLMIAEMITFYQNMPVFDDPKDPLYCEELLYTYIFYMNFVVPAIGILALLLHLPMKPVDNTRRRLQEAEQSALRRQQSAEGDPSQVYTAWIKPRRRRSRRNEENAESSDSRIRLNGDAERRDSRSCHNEENTLIQASSSRRIEETTTSGTVGGLQRDGTAVRGGIRVRWWDEAGRNVSTHLRDQESNAGGSIGGEMWDDEGAVGGPIDGQKFEEYSVIGAVGGHWEDEGAVGGSICGHGWGEEGAVGGAIGGHGWGEEGGRFGSHELDEGPDPRSRNRESAAFRSRHREERTAFISHRWNEANPEAGFSGSHIRDEKDDGLRSQKCDEGTEPDYRPEITETREGGVRLKRTVSTWDNERSRQIESTETIVGPLRNDSVVESDDSGASWNVYGARPKRKENVEFVGRTRTKEASEIGAKSKSEARAKDSARARRKRITEKAIIHLGKKEDTEIDAFGNQCNKGNEGVIGPKNKVSGILHAKDEDVESGTRSKLERNTEVEMKESIERGDNLKRKAHIELEIKEVSEEGALPKAEECTDSGVTSQIKENTTSSNREKRKETTEDDDRL